MKIISSKHFAERLQNRKIDLSIISKIHEEIAKNPINQNLFKLVSNGATIIFQLDREKGEVKLITGYPCNKRS
ncbi:Uncharacterised protein [Campylobacter insulaenigrae]|uniref:hypothetical protein n=1 Tax=Campylobacter insulaenigrae TaxID=260714 RepID=UPI000F6DCF9C|nr:hypothetical protein [Campylobacter insulaenigrae]MCR6574332.1 hypothetical protein [Campylobacter insulaenigrae]MCR6590528.1 hypothetical protein [Campylobacter insulaenigrae]MCR6592065.1 hypothetical protein [Campylobacter insulaenigrae]VEJ53372.1 Uncharacterised protein [Campylobacter insulaenigrae]